MFLRINRILFGSLIFGFLMGFIGALSYSAVAIVSMLFTSTFSWAFLLFSDIYVFVYCTITCLGTFVLSGIVRGIRKNQMPVWSGYLFLILSALPINVYLFMYHFQVFHSILIAVIVFLSTIPTVYFGEKLYLRVWEKINLLNNR